MRFPGTLSLQRILRKHHTVKIPSMTPPGTLTLHTWVCAFLDNDESYNWCPLTRNVESYRRSRDLIRAVGMDTQDYDDAIENALTAVASLRTARQQAVLRLKQNPFLVLTDGKSRLQDAERENLV